jgi:hypothetical protein
MPDDVLQKRWTDPTTFGTTLLVMFADRFGTAGLQWEPESILYAVENEFHVALPAANFDRLMAAISVKLSNAFYKDLPTFIDICNVLSGDSFDPRVWDPADSSEIAWGITEVLLLDPPDPDDEEPFTDEIRAYIGKVLEAEGIITPPAILRIALRDSFDNHPDTYSDDPEMFNAIYDYEASKTSDITKMLKEGLKRLGQQLDSLSLRTGDARGVVSGITKATA